MWKFNYISPERALFMSIIEQIMQHANTTGDMGQFMEYADIIRTHVVNGAEFGINNVNVRNIIAFDITDSVEFDAINRLFHSLLGFMEPVRIPFGSFGIPSAEIFHVHESQYTEAERIMAADIFDNQNYIRIPIYRQPADSLRLYGAYLAHSPTFKSVYNLVKYFTAIMVNNPYSRQFVLALDDMFARGLFSRRQQLQAHLELIPILCVFLLLFVTYLGSVVDVNGVELKFSRAIVKIYARPLLHKCFQEAWKFTKNTLRVVLPYAIIAVIAILAPYIWSSVMHRSDVI
jgi:hypothetical protein